MRNFVRSAVGAGLAAVLLSGCFQTPVAVKQVPDRPRLTTSAGQQLAVIKFDKAIFAMERGETIGTYSWNPLMACQPGSNLTWGTSRILTSEGEIASLFYEAASAANLNTVGNPRTLFESQGSAEARSPDYLVGARIDQLRMSICDQNWAFGPRDIQSGSASLRVTWQVYDVLARKVVRETVSEGSFQTNDGVRNGEIRLMYGAFASAARNFVFDPALIAGLSLPVDGIVSAHNSDAERLLIARQARLNDPIVKNIDTIRLATVTVDAGAWTGSGFFVAPNLVMTNHHVVQGQKFLKVKLVTGRDVLGEVVRSHPQRDVALIQVESVGIRPLSIRTEPVGVAEDIYAIGSPLDKKFAGTVTKGIVSRFTRNKQGLEDIQADVDIQGGNSGGALLDAQGNVVGVSYAGVSPARDGTSIGLNFFIPIADAMQKLNLDFGQSEVRR
jgi:S1-C subfamily serine protease